MLARRLLRCAELACGVQKRATVFEPLVADWQREYGAAGGLAMRAWVLVKGGTAFLTSVVVSLDTRDAVGRHTVRVGWVAIPVFAVLGAILYVQQLLWSLTRWATVSEKPPVEYILEVVFWSAPFLLDIGLVFAIVPACLALAAGRASLRQLALAVTLTVAASTVVDGWGAPLMTEQRLRHQYGGQHAETGAFARPTIADHVRLASHPDAKIAADARAALLAKSRKVLLIVALGLIGAALGRSRAIARHPIGVRTLTGYWLFGWAAVMTLSFLSSYLTFYLPLRPYRLAEWLPPISLMLVGLVAWIALWRAQGTPPRSDPTPAR